MRSKDLRNRPALTAIVWWNVLMPNCVRCPRKRARPNRKSVQAAEIAENASIAIIAKLQQSNEEMAEYLRTHVTKLLNDVLYTSSNLMHNSFAMSDRWN